MFILQTLINKPFIKLVRKPIRLQYFLTGDQILHPNGITISMDFKYLYIASTEYGIRVIDIENRQIVNEPGRFNKFDRSGRDQVL